MDDLLLTLFEIGLFFIFLVVNLQLFNTLRFDRLFKKGVQPRQIQLMYFFVVIIFTYLLTRSLMHVIELSVSLIQ